MTAAALGWCVAAAPTAARGGGNRRAVPAAANCRQASTAAVSEHAHQLAASSRCRRGVLTDATATAVAVQATALPELPPLDDNYERACAFTDFGNWLIPGRVMLGRYPFVEPSRCRSRGVGEELLRQLLAAGITTFVSLQAEIPEQSAMRIGGVDGFLPYRAAATLLATAMSPPPSIEEIAALRTPELDRYLPPRRHPSAWEQRKRIELDFVHCPVVDLGLPDADKLRLLLSDIAQRLEAGENLYVHCWGGRGRAGTVGACLLAHLYGISADEALQRIQRSFDTRKDGGRRSPETDEQIEFVRTWIAEYSS